MAKAWAEFGWIMLGARVGKYRYLPALTVPGEATTVATAKMQVYSAPLTKQKFLDFCCCASPHI